MNYYEKNKDYIKSYTQSYYVANREKVLARSKIYRDNNQDKIKEKKDFYKESLYNHLFYEAHRDKIREKANENGKKYYKKKKELNLTHIQKEPRVYIEIEIKEKKEIKEIKEIIKPIKIRYSESGVNPFV